MPMLAERPMHGAGVWAALRPYLSARLASVLDSAPEQIWVQATEVRLRAGRDARVVLIGREEWSKGPVITPEDLRECLEHLTQHSLYAWEDEIGQGFLTIPGGHRVGVAGRWATASGGRLAVRDVSGLNYRVARSVEGAAQGLAPWLRDGGELMPTLLVGTPGSGKTTLLRDLARAASDALYGLRAHQVAVIDERSEIAACRAGMPGRDVGQRTDVLDGCPKVLGLRMALRSLGPEVLVTDELGGEEDALAALDAARSGVRLLATAHAADLGEIRRRPSMRRLIEERVFRRLVLLSPGARPGIVLRIEDETGRELRGAAR
ncbi:MAG: stage III sporulation protein AA [Thermaerobacter sp.]|nr:stage III sporulation protein AA [Thermaerobacter sp.]